MKLDRTIDLIQKFEGEYKSIYLRAKREYWKAERLSTEHRQRVWQVEEYRRLPRWAKSQLDGYYRGMWDSLYMTLEWRVKLDDVYMSGKDVPTGRWSDVKDGAHFYPGTEVRF